MLHGVPAGQLEAHWHVVLPHIERALESGAGDYKPADVFREIKARDAQLWVWAEKDRVKAACVTKVIQYPQKKVCLIMLGAGDGLKQWRDDGTIEAWARGNGCTELEIYGRRGWGRALDGWDEIHTHFRKVIA